MIRKLILSHNTAMLRYIMVTGGRSGIEFIDEVQIVGPFSSTTATCPVIGNLPMAYGGMVPVSVGNDTLLCGGWDQNNPPYYAISSCYQLTSGTWVNSPASQLNHARHFAASIQLPGNIVWITGGSGASGTESTTEIFDGSSFKPSIGLPGRFREHCMAKINCTHTFIAGSFYGLYANDAYIVGYENEIFTGLDDPLEKMTRGRNGHGCGVIHQPNGPIMFVAGGYSDDAKTNIEMYIPGNDTWVQGPVLPREYSHGGSIDVDGGTIFVGGATGYSNIMFFDHTAMTVTYLDQSLSTGAWAFAAIPIYDGGICS